jgi:hypothetical protein
MEPTMSSGKGMSFYWGSYVHPPCEVYPEKVERTPQYSERGIRWATEYRLTVRGDLVSNTPGDELTPAEVTARIQQMDLAYNSDYYDCGFLMDGAATPHRMLNNDPDNLSGNQIVYRSWDNVLPTEYANTRSFTIIVRALFLHGQEAISSFTEYVTKVGTGGPLWELADTANGPEKIPILPKTKVTHVQRGTIVGTIGRISPPPPIWPLEEQQWRRVIVQTSPKFYGNPRLRRPVEYKTDYAYYFERLGPDALQGRNWWFG